MAPHECGCDCYAVTRCSKQGSKSFAGTLKPQFEIAKTRFCVGLRIGPGGLSEARSSGKSADFLRRRPPVGQRCTMPRLTESNKRILGALLLVAGSATSMTSSASMLALHLGLGALASRGVRRQIEVKTPPRRLPSSDRTLPRSACESLLTSRGGSGSLSV